MSKRQYTDEEKGEALAVLASNGGNVHLTSNQISVPYETLRQWSIGIGTNRAIPKIRDEKKEALADRLEAIAHKIVDALPDKIDEATLQQSAISIGIIVDKMRLLREEPTHISQYNSPESRMERLAAIFDGIRSRRDRSLADYGQSGSSDAGGESPTVH